VLRLDACRLPMAEEALILLSIDDVTPRRRPARPARRRRLSGT
jgi:hypothetical protein